MKSLEIGKPSGKSGIYWSLPLTTSRAYNIIFLFVPFQISGAGACLGRGAVRLPSQEGAANAQRGTKVLPTNYISP